MKICLISKYPPIEGGESSKAYWLTRGLGKRGHEIHVVTNAWEVESKYRENFEIDDLEQLHPKNVFIHNTDPFVDPSFIPYTKPYTEKIASLSIEIIREYNLQLIDSWYILPYVISGYIAKTITGKSQILRHAGSDITRLFSSSYLNTLFKEIFKRVDKIVTYPSGKSFFKNLGIPETKIFINKVSVNTKAFSPNVEAFNLTKYTDKNINVPIITYIGKVGVTKGIFELTQTLSEIKEQFILLLVCGGEVNNQRLKQDIENKRLENKTIILNFVPPWKIPSIMKISTCIVIPERDFPVLSHTPILPREAMSTGRCTILSEELYNKRSYKDLEDGVHVVVINPKNVDEFRNKLVKVIKNPSYAQEIGKNARKLAEKYEDFDGYLNITEKLYNDLVAFSS